MNLHQFAETHEVTNQPPSLDGTNPAPKRRDHSCNGKSMRYRLVPSSDGGWLVTSWVSAN